MVGTLTPRVVKRLVVVCVLGLLFFFLGGLYFHDVWRSLIGGVFTIGLVLLVVLNFDRNKPNK